MAKKNPWHKEPWVWLLIALPMCAVIGGMITLYLAVTTSDGLVVDDYYERGKTINMDLARDRAAALHGLRARLDFDNTSRRVLLTLDSSDSTHPAQVRLSLLHPTRPGHDQIVQLLPEANDEYAGTLQPLSEGHWYLLLEADDWRLSGTLQAIRDPEIVLSPATSTGP